MTETAMAELDPRRKEALEKVRTWVRAKRASLASLPTYANYTSVFEREADQQVQKLFANFADDETIALLLVNFVGSWPVAVAWRRGE